MSEQSFHRTFLGFIPFLLFLLPYGYSFSMVHAAENEPTPPTGMALTAPWELRGRSEWARIYIDSSGSIKGFVGDKAGPHARLLRRLKDILFEAQVLNFETIRFGLEVGSPTRVDFQQFADPATYTQGDTYLAGPLEDAMSWNRNGVILVLGDGVASLTKFRGPSAGSVKSKTKDKEKDDEGSGRRGGEHGHEHQGQGSQSAWTCDLGSDTACVALRIREYVERGHGFWIVGFRFPFKGPYWVEEGGPKAQPGRKLDSVTVPDRPFYVWIGARDATQGRTIVRDLIHFAREAQPPVPVMAIEVAPGLWEQWNIPPDAVLEEISSPPKDFCLPGGLLAKFEARESSQNFPIINVATRGRRFFGARMPLRRIDAADGPDQTDTTFLLRFRQDLIQDSHPGSVSLRWKLVPYTGSKKDRWNALDLCLEGRQAKLAAGTSDIHAQWRRERAIAPGQDLPWDAWSTDADDTQEAASRTVNLSLFFRHLLKQMMPEVDGEIPPPVASQTFLRIQFQE